MSELPGGGADVLAGQGDSLVEALADRFWNGVLELSPISATILGYDQGDDRLDDPGPEGRDASRRLYTETLAVADRIETGSRAAAGAPSLPDDDKITLDILRVVCRIELEQLDQRVDRLKAVDQMDGPQTLMPLLASFQRMDTPERFDRFMARVDAYPRYMAAISELTREGLASGLTAARIVVERVVAQLERMLALPDEESPVALAATPPSEAHRERLMNAIRRSIKPADQAFLDALKGPYLGACRVEPGLWSAPDGDALYRTQIRAWTSLDLDPAELHRIGLEELASIESERREIAHSLSLGDDTKAAKKALLSGPDAVPASADELLERARGQIERALAASPRYFGLLPRASVEVRPVEPFKEADSPAAYYYPPAVDGSRPGIYFVNTYDLPNRSFMGLASTSFHEAVPGHHFQIALQAEMTNLGAFRRLGARMAGMAYVEGWGLYSERLADEMGLYVDQAERFGMLDGQAWRAARLVVDTGIHAFHWSQERSIAQMLEAGVSNTDALIETDRYICQPAQALCYKVGQREIQRLRAEASARLGSAFDLRAFHDAVLGHGTLPLATLAHELPGWLTPR
jgi:uncharacterized protein (DUF885 family)